MEIVLIAVVVVLIAALIYFIPYRSRYISTRDSLVELEAVQKEYVVDLAKAEAKVHSLEAQLGDANAKVEKMLGDMEVMTARERELYLVNGRVESENKTLKEKLMSQKEEILELQKQMSISFEKMADKILEEKSAKFVQTNRDSIDAILRPLNESLVGFKQRVETTFTEETKQRSSLEAQVRELMEQTNKISKDANNLASALKGDSKIRGNWGEMILESILQQSGLVKDREYFLQQHIKDEQTGKTIIPDVLVKLPDERTIIIDSKVSLVAFDKLNSAQSPQEQQLFIKEHLRSIYDHIESLSQKRYDSNIEQSINFTMMFIPIEPAYMVAIQEDRELWAKAYSKRIIIISPTNLIACLKLMSDLWRRAQQSVTAAKIVEQGERLYEKFVGFATSMEEVGRHLSNSQGAYEKAVKQLNAGNGNLVRQVLALRKLGVQSSKEIPSKIAGSNQD